MGRQWAIILLTAAGILAAVSCSKDRPDEPRPGAAALDWFTDYMTEQIP